MARRNPTPPSEATTLPRLRGVAGETDRLALRCLSSADRAAEGRFFAPDEEATVFGRGRKGTTVTLADGALSRVHASCPRSPLQASTVGLQAESGTGRGT